MRLRFAFGACAALLVLLAGCARNGDSGKELTILIRMMPAQERFLRQEVVPKFEKENGCKVTVATFDNEWDIERLLKLEIGKKKPVIDVVKTPFEMTRVLAGRGLMAELTSVTDSAVVMQDLAEYHPLASGLGFVDGKLYYLPRKLETQILFYRKSKVADAVAKFDKHKARINKELKGLNGHGLPEGYTLESDPSQWDFYDIYVVGSIWANEEYNGVKMGRIAHRSAPYGGTALFLVDRALQLGATKEDILELSSDKSAEVFLWEYMFVKNGIYNLAMWQDRWKGSDIYNGIKDGKVFLTYVQQIDCFNIHGWPEDPGMPGYLPDKDDMGLVAVPKGVSFELDAKGKPLYEGGRSISTGGWWWGVPKTSGNKQLAYKFMRFITSKEIQARECSVFGMIPVRKDIIQNLPQVFESGWVGDIFKTSVDQIKTNELTTVPLVKEYAQISQLMVDAWQALCVEYDAKKGGPMNLSNMKMRLASDFSAKEEQILGKK